MARNKQSFDSIRTANKGVAEHSRHANSSGAAGVRETGDMLSGSKRDFLNEAGMTKTFSIPEGDFPGLEVGLSWNNIVVESKGFLARLLGRVTRRGVDLDLGCLYELKDGSRGSIQAFGEIYGSLDTPPYIHHTGDERTGDAPGFDEKLKISGQHWEKIERLLIYAYVYQGPTNWALIKPEARVMVPNCEPMIVTPAIARADLPICALATIDNLDGGVRLTNHSEYFSSHPAMDRAFGFGLKWEDGKKQ